MVYFHFPIQQIQFAVYREEISNAGPVTCVVTTLNVSLTSSNSTIETRNYTFCNKPKDGDRASKRLMYRGSR